MFHTSTAGDLVNGPAASATDRRPKSRGNDLPDQAGNDNFYNNFAGYSYACEERALGQLVSAMFIRQNPAFRDGAGQKPSLKSYFMALDGCYADRGVFRSRNLSVACHRVWIAGRSCRLRGIWLDRVQASISSSPDATAIGEEL